MNKLPHILFFCCLLLIVPRRVAAQLPAIQFCEIVEEDTACLDRGDELAGYPFVITLAQVSYVVELYSRDGEVYHGRLTNMAYGRRPQPKPKRKSPPQVEPTYWLYQEIQLDSVACTHLVAEIHGSGLDTLPTGDSLPGWHWGFLHCDSFYTAFKQEGTEQVKQYDCPWGQPDEARGKVRVLGAMEALETHLGISAHYSSFRESWPQDWSVSSDGYMWRIPLRR